MAATKEEKMEATMATKDRVTLTVETELLTLKEAAKELGVGNATIHRWANSGRLASFTVGPHATLTTLADVEKVKAERMQTR
jgi:excisionase family DNA binding protein